MSSIVSRIKDFIDNKGISVRKFEEKVGFSNGAFASQYKNNKAIGSDKVENILQFYPEINPEWLLTGKGSMLKEEEGKKEEISEKERKFQELKKQIEEGHFLKKKKNLIPFYEDVSTIGGTDTTADLNAVSTPTSYIDAGDWFRQEVTAAIRHYGDSMVEYPNGCILALKKITNQRNIVWGRNYVVETDEIRVTKRLQICPDDKNCVMAYSTNTSTYPDGTLIHQPFKIHKEDIRQVFLVLGSINKEYGSEPVFSLK